MVDYNRFTAKIIMYTTIATYFLGMGGCGFKNKTSEVKTEPVIEIPKEDPSSVRFTGKMVNKGFLNERIGSSDSYYFTLVVNDSLYKRFDVYNDFTGDDEAKRAAAFLKEGDIYTIDVKFNRYKNRDGYYTNNTNDFKIGLSDIVERNGVKVLW